MLSESAGRPTPKPPFAAPPPRPAGPRIDELTTMRAAPWEAEMAKGFARAAPEKAAFLLDAILHEIGRAHV